MELGLKDKHILVAGGLGGIGSKTVEILLNEGALVSIITQSKIFNKELNFKHTNKLKIIKTNYTKKDHLKNDLIQSIDSYRSLDGLITMIGSGNSDKKVFLDKDESKRIWSINYFYPRLISEVFFELTNKTSNKNKNRDKFITFCSSIASRTFLNAPTEYSTSKAALEKLTKELSWKLAPEYRVNCISPGNIFFKGGTWDRIQKSGKIDIDKMLSEKVPMNRLGNPSDIAAFTVFLSSSKLASFFNGSCVTIDGGQMPS